jgi:hypothetical protein
MARSEEDVDLAEAKLFLAQFAGVRTIGKGFVWKNGKLTKEVGIIVGVTQKLPLSMIPSKQVLPREILGMRVDVITVHEVVAYDDYNCQRYRPVIGGCGLGHYKITGGTLGEFRDDWNLEVSNNHVIANSNEGKIGDPIYQPAPICGGNESVATLAGFKKIVFVGETPGCPISMMINGLYALLQRKSRLVLQDVVNHVDVGFCRPIVEHTTDFLKIGEARGHKDAAILGSQGIGYGARGLAEDICTQVNVSLQVGYGGSKIAPYEDQTIHQTSDGKSPILPGHSGTTRRDKADGMIDTLYFAGSDTIGVGSPHHYVVEAHDELGL